MTPATVRVVAVPFLGANDEAGVLARWIAADRSSARQGDVLCVLETTKATVDVIADQGGLVHHLAPEGSRLAVGAPLAVLADRQLDDPHAVVLAERKRPDPPSDIVTLTLKARALIQQQGLTEVQFLRDSGLCGRIGEQDVQRFLSRRPTVGDDRRGLMSVPERVIVLGGVRGGGALLIVEALQRSGGQQPVAILDADPAYAGRRVLGIEIRGRDALGAMLKAGEADGVVIAFNRDLRDRDETFRRLRQDGVRFVNVVDPESHIGRGAQIGVGNVILGRTWIGACSQLGANNFISGGVHLEHGTVLGDSCAFGPGVWLSGNVTVGNRVRFATGIAVEPDLSIGDDAIIASGSVLRQDVAAGTTIRRAEQQRL